LATNSGGEAGSYTVTLKVDGRVVAAKEPSLAGRESETVTFAVSRDEIGTYSVNVNGLSAFFVVKETALPPATPPVCTALATGASTKPGWWLLGGILAITVTAIAVPLTLKWRYRESQAVREHAK
jgi:hypothetical protein